MKGTFGLSIESILYSEKKKIYQREISAILTLADAGYESEGCGWQ